jgi:hypothetical protein
MTTPLDIAVDIGRIVLEARAASLPLDLCVSADDLVSRFPQSGLSRSQILDALKEEAGAVGLMLN